MLLTDEQIAEIRWQAKREQTRRWLIGLLRDCRTRAQDGLADIPEGRREYVLRKRDIAICDRYLRLIGG